jgi:hypothetical protein
VITQMPHTPDPSGNALRAHMLRQQRNLLVVLWAFVFSMLALAALGWVGYKIFECVRSLWF